MGLPGRLTLNIQQLSQACRHSVQLTNGDWYLDRAIGWFKEC